MVKAYFRFSGDRGILLARRMPRRGLTLVLLAAAAAALFAVPRAAHSEPAATSAAGTFAVAISAPETLTIPANSVPPKFPMTFTFSYVGPPLAPPPKEALTRFTIRLSEYMKDMEVQFDANSQADGCSTKYGPSDFYGPKWTEFACTMHFIAGKTVMVMTGRIRPNGKVGTATTKVSLSTGESASATTEIAHPVTPPPPPPPPAQPAAIPGAAAAPTQTIVQTFDQPGEAQPEAVSIAPSAETVQVALTWPDASSSFDAVGFRIVSGSRLLAGTTTTDARSLKIRKIRKKRSLDVRITRVRKGKLKFKVVAKKLGDRTRVVAKVRQSKR